MPDLAGERVDYEGEQLLESAVPAEPYALFDRWLAAAFQAKEDGLLPEPTAMVVATSAGGRPSARTVLLKEVGPTGFTFYTNYDSRKGSELAANAQVALHFGWYPLQRQVRIEGTAAHVARAESEAYFAVRPRGSQLGAWASRQSSDVASRQELNDAYAEVEQRFADADVPCPPHWGGIRVVPDLVEFWQGQASRMHDRLAYRLVDGAWTLTRLAP